MSVFADDIRAVPDAPRHGGGDRADGTLTRLSGEGKGGEKR